MRWQVKTAVRHLLLALPGGERAYRWLTAGLLGTNAGMAAKWFRVFPTHLQVLREMFGVAARAQRLWCFDSGATPAAGFAIALTTDQPGLLTDRLDRLADRYRDAACRLLREKGPQLAALSDAGVDRLDQLLLISGRLPVATALRDMDITYAGTHAVVDTDAWQGAVGCIFSAGTLEHYRPEQLDAEVSRMARALHPGGILSHVVDHRDHRWHADKRINPLQHLTLEEADYRARFDNPLEYHNRWLRSRYVALFTAHGFRVQCRDRVCVTPELPPLIGALTPEFRTASAEDLHSLVTHFIAIKV